MPRKKTPRALGAPGAPRLREKKAPTPEIITPAEDAGRMAFDLIQAVHTHLKDCQIEWLYTSKSRQSKGKPLYTKVKRLSPAERFLSTGRESSTEGCTDFQVIIDRSLFMNAHTAKQHAILDNALSYLGYDDEKDRFVVRAPDVVEFTGVVLRNGLWYQGLRQFGEACAEQLTLFSDRVKGDTPNAVQEQAEASAEKEFAMEGAR